MARLASRDDVSPDSSIHKVHRMGIISTGLEYISSGLNQCGYWSYDWHGSSFHGKGNQVRHIDSIGIHCSATRANWMKGHPTKDKVAEIRRWHTEERGWSDIGYTYVIDRDGTVAAGRPISRTPAHAKGHNKGSIGICLLGGHGGVAGDSFLENFTPEQDKALRRLLDDLKGEYQITSVWGHNEVSSKACPCFQVEHWLHG